MKVVVLGAGLVGGPMAADLARDERFEVTVVDNDAGARPISSPSFVISPSRAPSRAW